MDAMPQTDPHEDRRGNEDSLPTSGRGSAINAVMLRAWAAHRHRWKRFARRFTKNGADAEDAVQDAVTRTLRADPTLANEAETNRYVLSAVRTSALRVLEQRRRYPIIEIPEAACPQDNSTALSLMEAEELRQEIKTLKKKALDCLERLNPEQRQAIELLVLREPPLKLREVSEVQGVAISTVHSRLREGIRKIGSEINAPPNREGVRTKR